MVLATLHAFSGSLTAQFSPSAAEIKPSSFVDSFEDTNSWRVDVSNSQPVEIRPQLFPSDREGAGKTGFLQITSQNLVPDLRITRELPPASRIDDVTAAVWVRSTCPNVRFLLKLVFPHYVDPRTGRPLEADLIGDRYTQTGEWQELKCAASDEAFQNLLIRLRAQLSEVSTQTPIDTREVFITQAVLMFDALPSVTYLATDDLRLEPVITPAGSATQAIPRQVQKARLHFGNDRVLLDGKAFFPLLTTYHGEQVQTLQDSVVNMVWIEDYHDQDLVRKLQDLDLGIIAQPPRISRNYENLSDQRLPPFDSSSAPVWAWMLGRQIPEQELHYLASWATALRDADRQMPRPVFAEVKGLERQFHRYVSMLGTSDITVHSAIDPLDAVNRLEASIDSALPGKPMFTFIPVEPADARIDALPEGAAIPILEPEQILRQGFAALTAGYRGIGFSKRFPLDDTTPGLQERLLAIRLFNLHVRILEPWLATGRPLYHLEALVGDDDWDRAGRKLTRTPFASRWDTVVAKSAETSGKVVHADRSRPGFPIRATVFQTDFGHLILLAAFEPGSQFVPGSGQAENVRILIVGDAMQAWEVTPTDVGTSNLEMTHEPGGTAIHLKKFDQFAAILINRDASVIESLKRRVRESRHATAETLLAIAEQKMERTTEVHQQLVELRAPAVPEATRMLFAAEKMLSRARQEFSEGHDSDAYFSCQQATGYLRRLQRKHWENATASLPSSMSSPYFCSFQSLPDHWKLLAKVGRHAQTSENLLTSGDFENHDELESSWGYAASARAAAAGMIPRVELVQEPSPSQHALSITLPPPTANYLSLQNDVPWEMITPEIACRQGEILHITGRVKIPADLDPVAGGFAIYDSLLGRTAAVRLSGKSSGWERFTILREVPRDGVIRLHFEMNSPGKVLLDDVQVKALSTLE